MATSPGNTIGITQIDPTQFPEICTYVEVLDSLGMPIGGLDADSFCVYQDYSAIDSFTVTETTVDSCYTSICLVIDVSSSMTLENKLVLAKQAANNFIDQMDPFDRIAIVSFSTCYTVVQGFTSDQTLLHNAVNSLTANGYTAVFDAIWVGVDLTIPEYGSKAVIAFSDGAENRSWECSAPPDGIRFDSFADDSTMIINYAVSGGVPIYTISLGTSFDPYYLQAFSAGTGGTYFHATTANDIQAIYENIKFRLCSRYLICYASPDIILDGDCHDVTICQKDEFGVCSPCDTSQYCEPYPPSITTPQLPCQPWEQNVQICATVTDPDTPPDSLTVRLFYRNMPGSYMQVSMIYSAGQFCATIPASYLPCGGDDVEYYVTASDGTSTVAYPVGGPTNPLSFPVCPNHDPVCIVPPDQTIVQCQPEEVCFPISSTDEDGNLLGCEITDPKSGESIPYSDEFEYCITPIGTETITISVHCWDDCGGECYSSFIVNFIIDEPPVLTCPPNYTFNCDAVGDFGEPTVDDENPATVTLSMSQDSIPGDCEYSYQLIRTWTATDECGNKGECTQTITVRDVTKPVISGVDPDADIECPAQPVFSEPTVSDNCDPNPTLTITDDETQGECPYLTIYTRTWTATDACGNTQTASQTIRIVDTTPPTIACPNPLTLQCGDTGNDAAISAWLASVTGSDACGVVSFSNNYSPIGFAGGCGPGTGSQTVTFTATDACGLEATCTSTIAIEDTLKPTFTFCPADLDLECGDPASEQLIADWLGSATASDQCDADVAITNDFDPSGFTGGCSNNTGSQLVTWTATDDCGNTVTCTATIIIHDTQKPWFTVCPADLELECNYVDNSASIAAWLMTATAADQCDADVSVTNDFDIANLAGGCSDNTGTVLVTFTATDDCGNTETCQARVLISDTQNPVFTLCPTDLTQECGLAGTDLTIAAWLASASADDQCDASVDVTNDYDPGSFVGGCSPETGSQLVTFTATDDCGNTAICQATVSIVDTRIPSFYAGFCPDSLYLECADPGNDAAIAAWLSSAYAVDECDASVDLTNDYNPANFIGGCSAGTGSQLVTFIATDDCGNQAICPAYIVIRDTQKPVFSFCPSDLNLECGDAGNDAAITAWLGSATADDDCDASVDVTNDYDPQGFAGGCSAGTGSQLVTFTATDDCGNFEVCQATITISDTQKPVFSFCPGNLSLECGDVGNDAAINAWLASAGADDQCDASVDITNDYDPGNFIGGCSSNTGSQVVTFTATDDCGNSEICQATITISDTQKPYFTLCPGDLELECADPDISTQIDAWLHTAAAADQCDNGVLVTDDFAPANFVPLCGNGTGSQTVTFAATDECGNFETCQATIYIRDTQPPTCQLPGDLLVKPCTLDEYCVPVTATDECDPDVECMVLSGPGTIVNGQWCYTPTGDEVAAVTVRCVDNCGNECMGSFTITFDVNDPPVCSVPGDATIFQCAPEEVCLPVGATDPNNNLTSCAITSGPGVLNNGMWCYTPAGDEVVTVEITCTDDCGATCVSSFTVTFVMNQPPVCTVVQPSPPLCFPPELTVPINSTDPEGGSVDCSVVSGPGTITDGVWHWIPTPGFQGTVVIQCVDACGAFCEVSFNLDLPLMQPPACVVPTTDQEFILCGPQELSVPISAIGGTGVVTCTVLGGPGSIVDGNWVYLASVPETFVVTVRCEDECGEFCEDSFTVVISGNDPPTITCPAPDDQGMLCEGQIIDDDGIFNLGDLIEGDAIASDPEYNPLDLWIFSVTRDGQPAAPVNAPTIDAAGHFSWQSTGSDTMGTWEFCLAAADVCASDTCCFSVELDCQFYLTIRDETGTVDTIPSLPGEITCVYVNITPDIPLGGFDLLFSYDQSALTFIPPPADLGDLGDWEYFTYRTSSNSNCSGGCPSGLIRVVAIADLDNGPSLHPPDDSFTLEGNIIRLCFEVTRDWNFLGQCLPIDFTVLDCGDNTLSSKDGNITYLPLDSDPVCLENPKPGHSAIEKIKLCGGWICVREPNDERGDLNLDGISNSIADAVLYSNYFIYGESVFDPVWKAVQIQASDVNNDGITLTVSDLVYLIRIITGDETPFPSDAGNPKTTPYEGSPRSVTAMLKVENGRAVVSANSPFDLGGAHFVFRYSNAGVGAPILSDAAAGMVVRAHADKGELRVLIAPRVESDITPATIPAGAQELFSIPLSGEGEVEMEEAQFADEHGAFLGANLVKAGPPKSYALLQNYPNPFNAGTVIPFDLRKPSSWTITVYNITGQTVRTFSGRNEASHVSVTWDGTDRAGKTVASGIYFYRIVAGDFTATRKMTLLK